MANDPRKLLEGIVHGAYEAGRAEAEGGDGVAFARKIVGDNLSWLAALRSDSPVSRTECAVCGEPRMGHCEMDQPGVDHPSSCGKKHHEFRPASTGGERDEHADCRRVESFLRSCIRAGEHPTDETIEEVRRGLPRQVEGDDG